jgi:fructose-bisphosphate aldolase/6-deoxy-5-ketofructose 1-phosphate synthase
MDRSEVAVPLDVPADSKQVYIDGFLKVTHNSGKLMLFAGDQRIEHMNDDFVGENVSPNDADPEHFFRIASRANIGVFATQLGLISRYGLDYPDVPYLVKLNSKTNLVKTKIQDPFSMQLYTVGEVVEFKRSTGINILAVGYTVYLGSKFEATMLQEAAQIVYEAHREGLITVLWMYPRGAAVPDEKDGHLIAGAAGVGLCLGTDFVKINYPVGEKPSRELLREAVVAAGRAGVICAGGASEDVRRFLQDVYDQVNFAGAKGSATGRNVHQKPLHEAVAMCNAIFAITVGGVSVGDALAIYHEQAQEFAISDR